MSQTRISAYHKVPILPIICLIISAALLIMATVLLFFYNARDNIDQAISTRILLCGDGRRTPEYPWILSNTDQWPYVSDNIDVVKIYVGDFTPETDFESVRLFAEAMHEKDITVALEVGGLLDWHANKGNLSALYSFQEEYEQIKPFLEYVETESGFTFIDMIELDCPVRRMLFPFDQQADFHTTESAVSELVKVIRLWKDVLPDAEINNITNFPVWGWKATPAYFAVDDHPDGYGKYELVLAEIVRQTNAAGLPLNGLTIDNPYDYLVSKANTNQADLIEAVDWLNRLLDLEQTARSYNLEVNIVFNSEEGGNLSNIEFARQTLSYIEYYLENGGNPDGFWIQSWYPYPDLWLPEEELHSLTNLVKSVIIIINQRDN